jgi:hypothetical protein
VCVQALLRHEEEVEANSGVWWQAALALVPLDADAALAKGIKRGVDKARLLVLAGLLSTQAQPGKASGTAAFASEVWTGRAAAALASP